MKASFEKDVGVIGGGGHVGLPLALLLADRGMRTVVYDIDEAVVGEIQRGQMPFIEEGAPEMLERVLERGTLDVQSVPDALSECEYLIMVIGTPVDEHLNPTLLAIQNAVDSVRHVLRDGQVLMLRSTVFPGVSEHVQRSFSRGGPRVGVAFCPERVAQGKSLREFVEIPQIISAFDEETLARVRRFFTPLGCELIEMSPMEAELCKLMTNAWRYLQFATVNQFYMLATEHALDFDRILHGCRHNYPRMAGMPGPGLAAGPCLRKDTMQLAAFSHNAFALGHSAMLVNEALPAHLIRLAKREIDLRSSTAGILGMAFKAGSDDPRDSLSYKLRKLLLLEAREVLSTDPFVRDARLRPLSEVLARSDVLFVATPHDEYARLPAPDGKVLVDVWGCLGSAALPEDRLDAAARS